MRKAEWMSGKYGIMVHYLTSILSQDGIKKMDANQMADCFDVKKFVLEADKMGASWVIFPFGQNTGYYWSENPFIEERIVGRCTNRDLMAELAQALHDKNIRLIGYLPTEMDMQDEDMRSAFGWNLSSDKKVFMERYMSVVEYYSKRLGDKLNGWWFDGNYNSREKDFMNTHDWDNRRFDKEKWFNVTKAGNPDRVIAMCTGANDMKCDFEEEEYLPGESNDLKKFPWDYNSTDKQWHVLTWLDCFWMYSQGKMPDPKYTNEELYDYVRKCINQKGAVTLNIGIYEDGTLAQKTVRQVIGLKEFLNNVSMSK